MFRLAVSRIGSATSQICRSHLKVASSARNHGTATMTPEQFDDNYVAYFSRPDIDAWELRNGIHKLHGEDLVPEPRIIIAAMNACRRLNDMALAVRYLEAIQWKCGHQKAVIWPYLLGEIQPTLSELGIPTPEELGYDKPELYLQDVDIMYKGKQL